MRKGAGLILAAAGAALIWLFKHKLAPRGAVHRREITVTEKKGVCGIAEQPRDVTMRRRDQLLWIITSESQGSGPCDHPVEVCIRNWRPSEPLEDIEGGRFCRTVRPGHRKTVPARVKQQAQYGRYEYEVWIDGQLAVDPMVEIVP